MSGANQFGCAGEAVRLIEQAHRQAVFAGRDNVTEKDANKALLESLEDFTLNQTLAFQQTEQILAKDINTFPLGAFPGSSLGLPLPPNVQLGSDWQLSKKI